MSVSVEKLSSNRVKLDFTIDVEAFEQAMASAYRKNIGKIQVPGFRRGKAPRKVVERMYGEGIFYEDAIDELFPTVYRQAIEENDLKPVDQPDIEWGNIGGGEPLTFSLEVYVSPDVTLGEYTGLKATEPTWEVSEEQVDQQIKTALDRIARWVETDEPVENGSRATIDYLGTVDGAAFEGGASEGMPLDIGSGTFIPGFEEQLIGMKSGEERDITVTFPADYRAEDLAGKEAVFHVKLHENKKKELPELDDDFAKDVSEFDTLEEYKADIRSKLEESAERTAQNRSDNELIRAAVAVSEMDIPQAMIDTQVDNMLRDFQMRLMYQGMTIDNFLAMTGQTPDQVREQYRPDAEDRVKAELVLEAIRKKENFEPSDEQVEAEITKVSKDMGRETADFKESMTERDWEYMRDAAASEMVLALLRSSAVYEKPAPKEEDEKPKKAAKKASKAEDGQEKPAKKPAVRKKKADAPEDEASE